MIATDQFVFAHIPKAGGVFLQSVLQSHFSVTQSWYGNTSHQSLENLPHQQRGKPVFAVLRNPWAWYVSWFTFCQAEMNNAEFLRNYQPGENAFEHCISRLLEPSHSNPDITDYMSRERIGLLEMHRYHILDLDCPEHDISYGRLEDLATDFLDFLQLQNIARPAGLERALRGQAVNQSRHGPWRDYYSKTLRDTVAVKERRIIRLGRYTWEDQA